MSLKPSVFTLLAVVFVTSTVALNFYQERICPTVDGQHCKSGSECSVSEKNATSVKECYGTLQETALDCTWFTFNYDTGVCSYHTNDCVPLESTCTNCTSGPRTCAQAPKCSKKGVWENCKSDKIVKAKSYDNCLEICKDNSTSCTHFTFSSTTSNRFPSNPLLSGVPTCETFHGNCTGPELSDDCPGCISGEERCQLSGQLECYEKYCCHGNVLKTYRDIALEPCITKCKEFSACAWYTYYNDLNICYLLDTKGETTDIGTDICTSGQQECPTKTDTVCGDPQCCDGKVLETHLTDDPNQCLEKCQDLSTCMWFTFRTTTNDCLLQESCDSPFVGPGTCIRGEKSCESIEPETTTTTTTTPSSEDCWKPGKVIGGKTIAEKLTDREECFQKCLEEEGCLYVTFYSTNVCERFNSFDELSESCTKCFSRSKEC